MADCGFLRRKLYFRPAWSMERWRDFGWYRRWLFSRYAKILSTYRFQTPRRIFIVVQISEKQDGQERRPRYDQKPFGQPQD